MAVDAMISAIVDELAPNLVVRNSIGQSGVAPFLLTAGSAISAAARGSREIIQTPLRIVSPCAISRALRMFGLVALELIRHGGLL